MPDTYRLAPQEYDPAIPVGQISEHPDNPNEADTALLEESLAEFGFVGAVVVRRDTRQVIAGNHRYREAVAAGAQAIPGFWLDWDEETARKWMITDNDTARRGRIIQAKLLALLEPMKTLPPGYTTATVEDLAARIRPAPGTELVSELGEVRMTRLADITPYEKNPRAIPSKAVEFTARSIRQFGWQQPIVLDTENVIIIGHVRRLAALDLKQTHVPAVVAADLSPDQVKALRVAENRSHQFATWQYGILAGELAGLEEFADVLGLADWQAIITGFEEQPDGMDLPEGDRALFGLQFPVTVLFASQEDADKAGPAILKLPGVLDVRYARK